MNIRPALPSDWPAIESLLSSHQLPLDGARENLGGFVVAVEDGAIVGCAALERYGSDAVLRSVAVREGQRGQGQGAALVRHLLEEAGRSGLQSLVLLTTTADAWFPRFGFREVTRAEVPPSVQQSAEFRGACPDSAVVMRFDQSNSNRTRSRM